MNNIKNHDGKGDKPYDLTMIYAISDNNPGFLDKLLLMFSETILKEMQGLKASANSGDWSEVGQVAHKMKTSLTHFGVAPAKDIILRLERNNNSSPEQLNLLVAALDDIINDVLLNLREEFPDTFKQ